MKRPPNHPTTNSPNQPVKAHSAPWKPLARKAALIGAAIAIAGLAASAIIAWSWRGDLPTLIASHWGADGHPNGFASPTWLITTITATGAVCALALSLIASFWGSSAGTRRIAVGVTVWVGLMFATCLVAMLAGQRGMQEATSYNLAGWVLPVALLGPFVVAIPVAITLPGDPPQAATGTVPSNAPRVQLASGERAQWIQHTGGGPTLYVGIVVVGLTTGLAVLTRMWALLILPGSLIIVFAMMTEFTVRVDAAGLLVRSAFGWPRSRIPANEVEEASLVQVKALKDFGGLGWRTAPGGRVGVVPHSGEAIEVRRTGGRSFVVVVDDAATGAAILNTMADRTR
ncbi:MAG: DUF1648 domain-containing protein [Micrococcales bacterium]|nr:DUF1648 domain-containing protein [Micrococcales bacterium]